MASTSTKIGHGLAKFLRIKLDEYDEPKATGTTRGESVYSVDSADAYVEYEPTSAEWIRSITPTGAQWAHYISSLFPFIHWITRYNVQWLIGDLIAGITIGAVVVPQGMAYAKLAEVDVQFGLYTSFMGVLIYWFFATSKDITIGPVAVLSTITGDVVLAVQAADPTLAANVIASALAIIAGSIVFFIGLVRLGWLTNLISLPVITSFMTGSAINIAVGQTPTLLGIKTGTKAGEVNSRGPTYMVIIHTLQKLPTAKIDAALGVTALFLLYFIRFVFTFLAKKQPTKQRLWFFLSTLRTVFVILLYTFISWLVNIHLTKHNAKEAKLSPFTILGHVPRGFQDAGAPKINTHIISLFASYLPVTVIVMLIEHISISKSFGRVNNYTINPSQELVAIGITNLLGPFLGAYPATGSFSRTAIKSKAGVRTPFAGVITAVVVLLAIYALPAVFFFIPSAALSAVVIHAVGDLITPPNTVYRFWRISPLEVIIFFAGVLVTIFSTIEYGIYTTVSISMALYLFRAFKAQGRFVGRVKVHSVLGGPSSSNLGKTDNDPDRSSRNIFLPLDHGDGSNPSVTATHPYPGIFIYRFSEGFNYPNADHYLDYMVEEIFKETRRTDPNTWGRPGDRPWNNPGPRRGQPLVADTHKPTLRAVILDFSSVNNVDLTSVQHLIDVRNQLDRYTNPDRVQWHFACINNRWTKRALTNAGFGYPSTNNDEFHRLKPIFSVSEIGGSASAAAAAEAEQNQQFRRQSAARDIESAPAHGDAASSSDDSIGKSPAYRENETKVALVQGLNRPFFHIDLTSALQSAIHNVESSKGSRPEAVDVLADETK